MQDANVTSASTGSSEQSVSNDAQRMDPEKKAAWVAALRSGKYPQTKAALRTAAGFCCLGVLCDIVDPSKWREGDRRYTYGYGYVSFLPDGIKRAYNVTNDERLLRMNDSGTTFPEIADWIEEHL